MGRKSTFFNLSGIEKWNFMAFKYQKLSERAIAKKIQKDL